MSRGDHLPHSKVNLLHPESSLTSRYCNSHKSLFWQKGRLLGSIGPVELKYQSCECYSDKMCFCEWARWWQGPRVKEPWGWLCHSPPATITRSWDTLWMNKILTREQSRTEEQLGIFHVAVVLMVQEWDVIRLSNREAAKNKLERHLKLTSSQNFISTDLPSLRTQSSIRVLMPLPHTALELSWHVLQSEDIKYSVYSNYCYNQ